MDLLRTQMENARQALAKCGAQQWELMAAGTKSVTIGVRQGEVDKHQAAESIGLAIRVIKDQRPGFSYIYGAEDQRAVELAVEQALSAARSADPEPTLSLPDSEPPQLMLETYDPAVASEGVPALIRRAERLASAALGADKRVVHVHPAEVSTTVSRVILVNSHGLDICEASTQISAGAAALAAEGDEQEMGWESRTVCRLEDIDERKIGDEAGRKAAAFLGGTPVADGRYDAVIDREVASTFLDILADGFLADNVAKGRSLLADKMNCPVLSPLVTIIDDGLMPRGLGSASFDDEGTAQSRTVLAEGGVIRAWLYDRLWAGRAGVAGTGNGIRASLKVPPGIGITNLFVDPGMLDRAQLIEEMGNGLIISEVMGAHTADPVTGEFSFGASGHLVQKGRIVRPVKSIAVAGQILEFFRAVAAVGSDLEMFGRSGAPSLLIKGLSVSGP